MVHLLLYVCLFLSLFSLSLSLTLSLLLSLSISRSLSISLHLSSPLPTPLSLSLPLSPPPLSLSLTHSDRSARCDCHLPGHQGFYPVDWVSPPCSPSPDKNLKGFKSSPTLFFHSMSFVFALYLLLCPYLCLFSRALLLYKSLWMSSVRLSVRGRTPPVLN